MFQYILYGELCECLHEIVWIFVFNANACVHKNVSVNVWQMNVTQIRTNSKCLHLNTWRAFVNSQMSKKWKTPSRIQYEICISVQSLSVFNWNFIFRNYVNRQTMCSYCKHCSVSCEFIVWSLLCKRLLCRQKCRFEAIISHFVMYKKFLSTKWDHLVLNECVCFMELKQKKNLKNRRRILFFKWNTNVFSLTNAVVRRQKCRCSWMVFDILIDM